MTKSPIISQTRAVMNAVQIPEIERFKLWNEALTTVTALDNLIPVTWNGITKTRYEHAGFEIPKFVKHLRTFGEAGIVKNGKDGKVGDRGITMVFVGHADEHAGNCYRMYNLMTSRVNVTQDVIWLGHMSFAFWTAFTSRAYSLSMSMDFLTCGFPRHLGVRGAAPICFHQDTVHARI